MSKYIFMLMFGLMCLGCSNVYAGDKEEVVSYTADELIVAALKDYAMKGSPFAQYELAKRHLSGDGVEVDRRLAEQLLINATLLENTEQAYFDLLEKEFGWKSHYVKRGKPEEDTASSLIHIPTITRDNQLAWYWSLVSVKLIQEGKIIPVRIQSYNVINCENRTKATKLGRYLGFYLETIKDGGSVTDDQLSYKPLDTSEAQINEYKIVCDTHRLNKEDTKTGLTKYGTGWPIGQGYVVTNQHVISGKKNIKLVSTKGHIFTAIDVIEDKNNDLALIRVKNPEKLPPSLPIARKPACSGLSTFTIGYPHPDLMGAKPKLSEGIVNSLTGFGDDPRSLQISAPIQSGNSGGPLFNMSGEVIGIVTSKLNAERVLNGTGDTPQNVNYATKVAYLLPMLDSLEHNKDKIPVLPSLPGTLESLVARVSDSILLVIAD